MKKEKYYRVYGKKRGEARFKAMDMAEGTFVDKLMYASFYYECELEGLKRAVEHMNKRNPEYVFEIREV